MLSLLTLFSGNQHPAKFSIHIDRRDSDDMVEPKGLFILLLLDNKPLGFVGSGLRGDGLTLALRAINQLNLELITAQAGKFEVIVVLTGDHFIVRHRFISSGVRPHCGKNTCHWHYV